MRLYFPIKPLQVNQAFGANPDYYKKFHDNQGNPLKGHDGIDFYAEHGTPVYAAHDGMAHFEKDSHGGEGIWIRGQGIYSVYWHLVGDTDPKYPSPIPLDGKEYQVSTGTLIGYADNTGAPYESSGTHLHFGLCELDARNFIKNMDNGFNGRVDPMPYFTGQYAPDVPQLVSLYQKVLSIGGRLLEALKNK